ncbi:uncharacterized protein LOC101856028 [Aplysia californica]|uniref:Uncharacterized protein LOC101856028 n=1 Tax=Aplysia californica TaxID=6500 RepID=A0ABM1A1M2_APLCA|nr:uncharacterized protein LOC101856028 [Aplysia californica]
MKVASDPCPDSAHFGDLWMPQKGQTDDISTNKNNIYPECRVNNQQCDPKGSTFIGEYLFELWKNQCLCDVKLKVGSQCFLAHKLVLAAFSDVFCPSQPQIPPTVCIDVPSTTPEALYQILMYLYTSEMHLTDTTLEPVLSAACFMGITDVVDMVKSILDRPTKENLKLYMDIRKRQGMSASLTDFPNLLREKFVELIQEPLFLASSLEELVSVLQDPELMVTSEMDAVRAVIGWLEYNPLSRMQHVGRLFELINLECVSTEELIRLKEEKRHLFEDSRAVDVVMNAFIKRVQCSAAQMPPDSSRPSKSKDTKANDQRTYSLCDVENPKKKNILISSESSDSEDLSVEQPDEVGVFVKEVPTLKSRPRLPEKRSAKRAQAQEPGRPSPCSSRKSSGSGRYNVEGDTSSEGERESPNRRRMHGSRLSSERKGRDRDRLERRERHGDCGCTSPEPKKKSSSSSTLRSEESGTSDDVGDSKGHRCPSPKRPFPNWCHTSNEHECRYPSLPRRLPHRRSHECDQPATAPHRKYVDSHLSRVRSPLLTRVCSSDIYPCCAPRSPTKDRTSCPCPCACGERTVQYVSEGDRRESYHGSPPRGRCFHSPGVENALSSSGVDISRKSGNRACCSVNRHRTCSSARRGKSYIVCKCKYCEGRSE